MMIHFKGLKKQAKLLVDDIAHLPVDAQEIKNRNNEDLVLARVRQYILTRWSRSEDLCEECKQEELGLEDSVLSWVAEWQSPVTINYGQGWSQN